MTDILIAGAGPVGFLLASLLGQQKRNVLVLEKKNGRNSGSNAIGISPPSLEILQTLGLASRLIDQGAPIRHVTVHGSKAKTLGRVNFTGLSNPFNFILSVPQGVTEKTLEDHLQTLKSVHLDYGWELIDYQQTSEGVQGVFKNAQGLQRVEQAKFLVGCDGLHSKVRQSMGIKHNPKGFKATFLMGDFIDRTSWENDAHLFFTPFGAVESFPLGQGKRRWIVQTPCFMQEPKDYLEAQVFRRTGLHLSIEDCTWKSPFGIQRWVSPLYAKGRVYIAGDSAHQMSPIGGQGMNTGFADAEFLAALLERRLQGVTESQAQVLNGFYTRLRRKAGFSAAKRAELSMALGTVTGPGSVLRNLILKAALTGACQFFPAHYSMLTIPYRNAAQARARYPELQTLKL